jgi:hypothetical protein
VVSPLFLVPTTIIIIATYCILIYGFMVARKHRDDLHEDDLGFDPTDIVHVIAAHSPETRKHEFRRFSQRATSYMRGTAVQMQSKEGVRAFAISARPASARSTRHGDSPSKPLIGGDRESDDHEAGLDKPAGRHE